ncbi:thiol reductant ABC exporter subunit CydC [Melioribacteraceae bacterium 4301-Me]|uniref:thiol reductant ABC exporter subunit CydC n=1 Tax=Pyranulibacter aquaticus TaxID=3163344 RepID=UPI00359874F5
MNKTFFKIVSLGLEYKYWMLLAALMSFLVVGSGIGLMMASSYIIACAAILTPIYKLEVAIVGVRFFGIFRGVFRYIERYISHEVTFKLLAKFRVWFFKSLIPLIPSKKKDMSSGDLLSRSIEDIESLEHIFVRVISPPLVFLAVAVTMFFLLSIFNIKYSIAFLIMFLGSAVTISLLTYLLSKNLGEHVVELKSQLQKIVVDSIQGLSELIIYNYSNKWEKEYDEIENQLLHAERKMMLIQSFHENLTGLAMNLTVAVLLCLSIPEVTKGNLNGVYLSVITIGIMASFEIVAQLPVSFQYLSKSIKAGNRLLEITEQQSDEIKIIENKDNEILSYELDVQNVSFSYNQRKKALSEISFRLRENEKIAIVGASGAGKSTLVNIICRLWNYDRGEILIDRINFKKISDEKIRKIISVVPQKVHLFTGTIRENLLIAKEDASDEELNYALKQAELLDFVESLHEKLDTNIGELGKKLSGGEIKRLAIARVLLRNSPILIFDEINSHVDSQTEMKILKSIRQISNGKQILFITHRLVDMEMFNEILVLSNGKIIERGTHSELINHGLYYKKMLTSQNRLIN